MSFPFDVFGCAHTQNGMVVSAMTRLWCLVMRRVETKSPFLHTLRITSMILHTSLSIFLAYVQKFALTWPLAIVCFPPDIIIHVRCKIASADCCGQIFCSDFWMAVVLYGTCLITVNLLTTKVYSGKQWFEGRIMQYKIKLNSVCDLIGQFFQICRGIYCTPLQMANSTN